MYRSVATALVALAAFDYFYLDGRYLHYVQAVAESMLHFFDAIDSPPLPKVWSTHLKRYHPTGGHPFFRSRNR
jgi:hypothetical protein